MDFRRLSSSAPTSGDPSGTVADQMPFLFTTALAYGNVIDISGEYGDAMQGVVVEDASQIEIILEASDELAWDVLDAKLFEIMSGGGEPDEIIVGPEQWINAGLAKNELANGIYSGHTCMRSPWSKLEMKSNSASMSGRATYFGRGR